MPHDTKDTTPEMPAVDDEATRIDSMPVPTVSMPEVSVPTAPVDVEAKTARVPERKRFGAKADEEDDDATQATGTPKKAREAQRILEESRRMNARGGPQLEAKKLHPLVPLGVAFVLLAALLLAINWFVRSSPPDGGETSGLRNLFDW